MGSFYTPSLHIEGLVFFIFLHWTLFTLTSQVWSCLFVCVGSIFHLIHQITTQLSNFFRDLPVIPRRLQDVDLVQVPEVILLLQLTSAAWSGDVKLYSDGLLRGLIPRLGDPPPKIRTGFVVDSEVVDLGWFLWNKKAKRFFEKLQNMDLLLMTLILLLGGARWGKWDK